MTLPNEDDAVRMSVEELAGHLVLHHQGGTSSFNVHNVMCMIDSHPAVFTDKPIDYQKRKAYKEALVEAYAWGFTEGMFTWDPGNITSNFWRVSRRGRLLKAPMDTVSLSSRNILPEGFIHPEINQHAGKLFRDGSFDAAVFQAFKQVEIAVKNASGINEEGASLMKKAFSKSGPLNMLSEPSEQEGLMFVFAGAMQLFRNAVGHKNQNLDPQDAAHLLIHASYLMTLLELQIATAASTRSDAATVSAEKPVA